MRNGLLFYSNMTNNIGYNLWLGTIQAIPTWELLLGIGLLAAAIIFFFLYALQSRKGWNIFHAFEKLKIKRKDLDKSFQDNLYFEITIPQDSTVPEAILYPCHPETPRKSHSRYVSVFSYKVY